MKFVILIFVGFLIFLLGNHLLDDFEGEKFTTIGTLLLVCGIACMIIGLFMTRPIEPKASKLSLEDRDTGEEVPLNQSNKVRGAGITAHMGIVLYNAMNEEEPSISEDDIELLARLITAEQGYNADEEDYYLTGSVVINRINSNKFPNILTEVVYQSGQYACVNDGHIKREYDDVAWEIAEELLTEGTTIDSKVVFQAEFPQGSGTYMKRGNTYYCYE